MWSVRSDQFRHSSKFSDRAYVRQAKQDESNILKATKMYKTDTTHHNLCTIGYKNPAEFKRESHLPSGWFRIR